MDKDEIGKILEAHKLWIFNQGGERADLRGAYLRGANLRGADLQGAYLQGADLRGAYLRGAKNMPDYVRSYLSILPDEGDVIGWKKLKDGKIAKLLIATLKRSNATNRKCRAEFATVLNIYNGKKEVKTGFSTHKETFKYTVGEIVTCDEWNEDWTVECGGGIHFFITRQEAEDYN